jgi:large subunit ribosomal protein L29
MKNAEIIQMTDAEMLHQLDVLNKEKFNLRIQAKTGQLQNSARIRTIKKDIARMKTEVNKRAKRK